MEEIFWVIISRYKRQNRQLFQTRSQAFPTLWKMKVAIVGVDGWLSFVPLPVHAVYCSFFSVSTLNESTCFIKIVLPYSCLFLIVLEE